MKQQEYFGFNSINNLEGILKNEKIKNVFLITGRKSFELCGAKHKLHKIFNKTDCKFARFYDFSPNPKLKEIQKGLNLFRKGEYDCIMGVGGGSAIDVAKSIKFFHYKKTKEKKPLIAIPTTAGSGSEATYFIVYYVEKEKKSEGNPVITLPDYAICDPQLTISSPKRIAASTGMDALTQAIESYWSIHSTNESKNLASRAIRLILNNLEELINSPSNKSRRNMLKAANLAGKAINITQTTACHSIAYPITSYFNIPHGHAVALTLAEMLVYNSEVKQKDCVDKRGQEYVKGTINKVNEIIGVSTPIEAKDRIYTLMKNIELETKFSELGLTLKDIELIIKKGFNIERVKNNPRLLTRKNLRKILENIEKRNKNKDEM